MKRKPRTEITFETHEVTIIRFRKSKKIFCETCREVVPHLWLEGVAMSLPLSEPEVHRLTSAGLIHSTPFADGRRLLCSKSLADIKDNNNKE